MTVTVRYKDGTENYVTVRPDQAVVLVDEHGIEHHLLDWSAVDRITA